VTRFESAVTSLSWIPADVMKELASLPFDVGLSHFDLTPPQEIDDFATVGEDHPYRFANQLRAWIEVNEEGDVEEAGYCGGGELFDECTSTDGRRHVFHAAALPIIQPPPEFGDGVVRFVQSYGGLGSTPVPRTLRRAPFVQWRVPLSWTTLALTMHVDGSATHQLVGASQFPRHWVYNAEGKLVSRTGLVDADGWYRHCFDASTPWGERDSKSLADRVHLAIERSLSRHVLAGGTNVNVARVPAGTVLARQGDVSSTVFVVLDGYVCLQENRRRLAEFGPGATFAERATLAGAARTTSLVATTKCRLARVPGGTLDEEFWDHLASGRRRAEPSSS
jgi:hypothetical protein